MFRRLPIGLVLIVLVITSSSALGAPSDPLTPNLKAFPATDLQVERSGNKRILRFSTTSGNVTTPSGAALGPLELRAGEVTRSTKKQKVYQRVALRGGGFEDRLVGEFVWHPAHNHFHFENYARYELQPVDAPGASQRIGTKTSFCIMDTTPIDLSLPGAPGTAAYNTCGNQVQGMSVGWGDRYGFHLAGQEIDVTGLPEGTYRLRIVIDPQGRLQESSTQDNTSEVLIRLAPTAGTVQVL